MDVLFFSILLNIIVLLIVYFSSNEKKNNLKILIYFGIFIGFFSLCTTYLFDSCFGASTPIDVKTQNLTNQNLKIYTISFWDNYGNGIGNYVNYDSELEPNETFEFCIDNDERFRAYEIYKYRITYYVGDESIFIVRIRHTKMNPHQY